MASERDRELSDSAQAAAAAEWQSRRYRIGSFATNDAAEALMSFTDLSMANIGAHVFDRHDNGYVAKQLLMGEGDQYIEDDFAEAAGFTIEGSYWDPALPDSKARLDPQLDAYVVLRQRLEDWTGQSVRDLPRALLTAHNDQDDTPNLRATVPAGYQVVPPEFTMDSDGELVEAPDRDEVEILAIDKRGEALVRVSSEYGDLGDHLVYMPAADAFARIDAHRAAARSLSLPAAREPLAPLSTRTQPIPQEARAMQGRMSDDEVVQLARDYLAFELERTEFQASPRAVLLTGQSGSGKSTVRADLEDQLARQGGSIVVDVDELRSLLPYVGPLDRADPGFSARTQVDAVRLAGEVRRQAATAHRNIIVDGALRELAPTREMALELSIKGYRTELHALAVNDQVSMVRSALRYEREASAGHPARIVPQGWHDAGYAGVANTVKGLEYAASVERLVVYNRLGDVIHDAPPERGASPAAEALSQARDQLTSFERVNIAEHWDKVVESMDRRSAPPEVVDTYRHALGRAHYTLRSSVEAADRYDHEHPADRYHSQDLADDYGATLAGAFRTKRSTADFPELRPAYAAVVSAERDTARLQPDDREAMLKRVRDQVAESLLRGRPPAYELKPPLELELDRLKGRVRKLMDDIKVAEEAGLSVEPADHSWLKKAQNELNSFIQVNAAHLTIAKPASEPAPHDVRNAPSTAPRPRAP